MADVDPASGAFRAKSQNKEKQQCRSATVILAMAALVCAILNFDPQRASGDRKDGLVPLEAMGFSGTLSGEVVKVPDKTWLFFQMKVIKVVSLGRNNKTSLKAAALTKVWKDMYVNVRGVKNMPALAVGDKITVVAAQFERHLRATNVSKQKKKLVVGVPKNSGSPPGAAEPNS